MKKIFTDMQDMLTHLDNVEMTDLWLKIENVEKLSLNYIKFDDEKEAEKYICLNTFYNNPFWDEEEKKKNNEQLISALLTGTLVLNNKNANDSFELESIVDIDGKQYQKNIGKNYLFDSTYALAMLFERIGIKGRLISRLISILNKEDETKMSANEVYISLCKIFNTLKSETQKCMQDEGLLMLIREEKIMAVFSKKYTPLLQSDLVSQVYKTLKENIEDANFVKGLYNAKLTSMFFSISEKTDDVINNFKMALTKAGYSSEEIKDIDILLEVKTSDVGIMQVTFVPYIKTNLGMVQLSESRKFKHYKNAQKIVSSVSSIISLARDKSKDVLKLMDINLYNPVKAAKYALTEVGIKHQKLINEMLEVINTKFGGTCISAFTLYSALSDVDTFTHYGKLPKQNRIAILENLYQLVYVNWSDADASTI